MSDAGGITVLPPWKKLIQRANEVISSTDMEYRRMKKVKSKDMRSEKVVIHAGNCGHSSCFFFLAITETPQSIFSDPTNITISIRRFLALPSGVLFGAIGSVSA